MKNYFINPKTLECLRRQYKELLKTYHPDNGGDVAIMQEINAEYDRLFKILKDIHESQRAKADNTTQSSYNAYTYDWENDKVIREILTRIINFSGIEIEIIGQWIWIFNCYTYRKELKELGFKFASNKKAWYFHTEAFRKSSKKSLSINDIRNYYGSTRVATKEMILLAE